MLFAVMSLGSVPQSHTAIIQPGPWALKQAKEKGADFGVAHSDPPMCSKADGMPPPAMLPGSCPQPCILTMRASFGCCHSNALVC